MNNLKIFIIFYFFAFVKIACSLPPTIPVVLHVTYFSLSWQGNLSLNHFNNENSTQIHLPRPSKGELGFKVIKVESEDWKKDL